MPGIPPDAFKHIKARVERVKNVFRRKKKTEDTPSINQPAGGEAVASGAVAAPADAPSPAEPAPGSQDAAGRPLTARPTTHHNESAVVTDTDSETDAPGQPKLVAPMSARTHTTTTPAQTPISVPLPSH